MNFMKVSKAFGGVLKVLYGDGNLYVCTDGGMCKRSIAQSAYKCTSHVNHHHS